MEKQKKTAAKKRDSKNINPKFIKLKKWINTLLVLLSFFLISGSGFSYDGLLWKSSDRGIDEPIVSTVYALRSNGNTLFAGTGKGIYRSTDSGKNWIRTFKAQGRSGTINFFSSDPAEPSRIFAATSDGLYASFDNGISWNRLFKGMDEYQRKVNCVSVSPDSSFAMIGTDRGAFKSSGAFKEWTAVETFINKEVSSIAIGKGFIFICTNESVYYSEDDSFLWKRIFIASAHGEEAEGYDDSGYDNEDSFNQLNFLVMDSKGAYLASDYGVYRYLLESKEWEALSREGLLTNKVHALSVCDQALFCATDKGVFKYSKEEERWRSHSAGLTTLKVNMIDSLYSQGIIFAATERGLFKADFKNTDASEKSKRNKDTYGDVFIKEPGILKVQQAAIDYAEVSQKKIEWMRRQAMNKAFLPKVSLGLDGDTGRTIDLDRGGTKDRDFYIEGPRDKSFGWDIDISWDLGELIWNDDQTNIDVRSRLMVQLRNDVLDEVTKLYFERRRLQIEFLKSPQDDDEKRALKQLRINELTANIDALTSGYFSDYIESRRLQSRPR